MMAPSIGVGATRVALALVAAFASGDGNQPFEVTAGRVVVVCPLTVGGRFEVTTTAVSGQATVDERSREIGGVFSVDLRTLDAGIGLRTTHLKENYLEVQRGSGFDVATLTRIVLDGPPASVQRRPVGFRGQFTLHGRTELVTGNVELSRKSGQYDVKVRFPLRIDAFHIAKPTYLGVGVANDIEVTVRATLSSASGTTR